MTVNWISGVWYFGERGSHNRTDWEKSWRDNLKIVEGPGVGRVLDWRVSALDWAENFGQDRESWIEAGPGLERGTWTRQRVLLWRDSL